MTNDRAIEILRGLIGTSTILTAINSDEIREALALSIDALAARDKVDKALTDSLVSALVREIKAEQP